MAENQYADIQAQAALPKEVLNIIKDIAVSSWEKIDMNSTGAGTYLRITQGPHEPYIEFVAKLKDALKIQVKDKQVRKYLEKSLAYHNANSACKLILAPLQDKADLNDFLYACRNVYDIPHASANLDPVQTFAVTKGTKPARKPGLCPKCKRGRHWAKDCRSGNLPKYNPGIGFNTTPRGQFFCYHCGKQGHIKRNCRLLLNQAPQRPTFPMQGNAFRANPQARANQGQIPQTVILPSPAQEDFSQLAN